MAWTVPPVWVTGTIVSASQLNTYVKDNLLDLDRRTTITADYEATSETTTFLTYSHLLPSAAPNPAVTVTVGDTGKALISFSANMNNNTAGKASFAAVTVTGATTRAASDGEAVILASATAGLGGVASYTYLLPGLTPGVNTFTLVYRVDGGTGTFSDRRLLVTPMGS